MVTGFVSATFTWRTGSYPRRRNAKVALSFVSRALVAFEWFHQLRLGFLLVPPLLRLPLLRFLLLVVNLLRCRLVRPRVSFLPLVRFHTRLSTLRILPFRISVLPWLLPHLLRLLPQNYFVLPSRYLASVVRLLLSLLRHPFLRLLSFLLLSLLPVMVLLRLR